MSKQKDQDQTNQAIEDLTVEEAVQQEVKGGALLESGNNIKQMGLGIQTGSDLRK